MLVIPDCWAICQEGLHTVNGTSTRERQVLQSAKLHGKSNIIPLTSHKELRNLEFSLLAFGFISI